MTPLRASGSSAPLLALALSTEIESENQLFPRLLRSLPEAPAEVLVLSPAPEPVGSFLRQAGFSTTDLALTEEGIPSFDVPAQLQAVLWGEGYDSASDPEALVSRLLELLPEGGVFVLLGFLSRSSSDQPSSLAALEVVLARHGMALSPPEDFSKAVLDRVKQNQELQAPDQALREEERASLESGASSYLLLRAKKTAFSVRAHQPGDEDAIADLFEKSFHHRRGQEHWRWEYLSNPWGGPHVTVAVDDEEELVAHYAGYPMRFIEDRTGEAPKILVAHQIGDTMTAPQVRHVGRGPTSLLARTAAHFFARFSTDRVAFNYGFNEGNIRRFSERFLGARYVEPVPFHQLDLAPGAAPFRPISWWRKTAHGERVEICETPPAGCDALLQKLVPAYRLLGQRDSAYLRWRYFERPGFQYRMFSASCRGRLVAWAVFRRQEQTLLLGDLLVDPGHLRLLEPILAAALVAEVGTGAQGIEGWFTGRPAFLSEELRRLGFEPRPHPQDLALMSLPFQERLPRALLREKFFYTLGDSDLF